MMCTDKSFLINTKIVHKKTEVSILISWLKSFIVSKVQLHKCVFPPNSRLQKKKKKLKPLLNYNDFCEFQGEHAPNHPTTLHWYPSLLQCPTTDEKKALDFVHTSHI